MYFPIEEWGIFHCYAIVYQRVVVFIATDCNRYSSVSPPQDDLVGVFGMDPVENMCVFMGI